MSVVNGRPARYLMNIMSVVLSQFLILKWFVGRRCNSTVVVLSTDFTTKGNIIIVYYNFYIPFTLVSGFH